jgi:hypothetical protein
MSDLKLDRKECSHCGAVWLNSQHVWSGTGVRKDGSELDLAGLVCNTKHGNPEKCINPCKGIAGGQTWESRLNSIIDMEKDYEI